MALHAMGPAPPPMGDHLGPLALGFAKIGASVAQSGVPSHVLTLAQSSLLTIDLVWVAPMPTSHATNVGHTPHGKIHIF